MMRGTGRAEEVVQIATIIGMRSMVRSKQMSMLLRDQKRVKTALGLGNSLPVKVRSPKQDRADGVHISHVG